MKQVKIPLILAAITVVAGIFAFAPINEASTVHTSGTITVGDNSIDADAIATNAIGSAEIADNAIRAQEIAASAIGASEIAANAIGESELAGAVEPLNNILTEASGDITGTLTLRCSGGTGDGLATIVAQFGADDDTLVIDRGAAGGGNLLTVNFEDKDNQGEVGTDTFSATVGLDGGSAITLDAAAGTTDVLVTVVCAAGDTAIAR